MGAKFSSKLVTSHCQRRSFRLIILPVRKPTQVVGRVASGRRRTPTKELGKMTPRNFGGVLALIMQNRPKQLFIKNTALC